MKLKANRTEFTKAFSSVSQVVPTRTTKDILKSVFLRTIDDTVTLAATDSEISMRADVFGCSFDSPGTALLPTARMLQILRELTADELTMNINERRLTLKAGSAEWTLSLDDPAEFPPMPVFEDESCFVMTPVVLQGLIKRTIFACDTESTRYALGGIQVEFTPERAIFAATDSRRLAVANGASQAKGTPFNHSIGPVVHRDFMKLLASVCDEAESIEIALHQNGIAIRCGTTVLTGQFVQGRFPDWRKVLPTNFASKVDMVAGPFLSCLRQSMIVTSEESRAVIFTFDKGVLKLASEATDIGTSKIELPVSYEGERIALQFDPRYLVDFAKSIDGQSFQFCITSSDDAAVLECSDYSYVIMPMSRDR